MELKPHKLTFEDTGGEIVFPKIGNVGWDFSAQSPTGQKPDMALLGKLLRIMSPEHDYEYDIMGMHQDNIPHICPACGSSELFVGAECIDDDDLIYKDHAFYIPDDVNDVTYRVPLAIIHYIRAHCYMPPQAFADAVLAFGVYGSWDYGDDARAKVYEGSSGNIQRDSFILDIDVEDLESTFYKP